MDQTMGRFSLAWKIITDGVFAAEVADMLKAAETPGAPKKIEAKETAAVGGNAAAPKPVRPEAPPVRLRSDAVTLLATLQREGRLIDFLKEPLDAYSDAQVGAAVRDIHRDCGGILERQFSIRPVVEQPEGSEISLGNQPDMNRFKLSGEAGQSTAGSGRLVHHGWQVTHCQLPQWTGSPASANIIAPAEVEVKQTT